MICLSTFLKDFSSENTGPISIEFHMQPLGKGGKKIYIFCPGHITKLAALLIYLGSYAQGQGRNQVKGPNLVSAITQRLLKQI